MTGNSVIYFVRAGGRVKIGVTTDLDRRLIALQVGSPVKMELLATIPGDYKTEKALHARFASARAHGEWFNINGAVTAFIEDIKDGSFAGWPDAGYVEAITPQGKMKATPAQFFSWLKVLFGADWQTCSARVIGVSRQTIFNWRKDAERGVCSISPAALASVNAEYERMMALMGGWISELKSDLVTDQ